MNITKAIEILHQDLGADVYDTYPDLYQAQRLGIEALKRIRDIRKTHIGLHYTPMQGETEE